MIDEKKIKSIMINVCDTIKTLKGESKIEDFVNAYIKKFPECEKDEYLHAGIIFMNMLLTIQKIQKT